MTPRIFHGNIEPEDLAEDLLAFFNRGNYQVQQFGDPASMIVQIATKRNPSSGGHTALTVNIQKVSDGVSVQLSNQAWFGVAASLGMTALSALKNPLTLLGRIDDLAQDVESIQLADNVWKVLSSTASQYGTGVELSNRLSRSVCLYCNTANPVASSRCLACGAPMGESQPNTCKNCGFVVKRSETTCPNCGQAL